MTIFLCEPGYTGILSGIYDAGVSKIPQDELRLEIKKQWAKCRAFCCIQGMQSIRRKREKGIGDSTSAIEFPYSGAVICGQSQRGCFAGG